MLPAPPVPPTPPTLTGLSGTLTVPSGPLEVITTLGSSSADAQAIGVGPSAGITVSVIRESTRVEAGFVAVSLPKGASTEDMGFRVPLPAELAREVGAGASASTALTVISVLAVINGGLAPLPSWLRYVPEQQMFVATAVPDGGLPITLEITVNGQRTLMVISERAS